MMDLDTVITRLNSHDRDLRRETVEALGEDRDGRGIGILAGLLKDGDPGVRDAAVNSLMAIGGQEVAHAVIPFLYEADDAPLRNMAVEILKGLGGDAQDAIIPLLKERDMDVLKFAIDIIKVVGTAEAIPHLVPLLTHQNPNIRADAVVTLGKLKALQTIPNLIDMLKDDDEWVRFSLLEALGSLGIPDMVDRLLDAAKQDDIARIAALDALSNLVTPEDCKKVMSIISSPAVSSVLSVGTVVRLIERFDGAIDDSHKRVFLDILITRLNEGDRGEARESLKGIRLLKDRRAVDTLLEFARHIKGDDEETISLLKDALIGIGDSDAIVEALKVERRGISILAEVLGEIGDPSALLEIQSLFDKVDRDVRKVLLKGIERIGDPSSLDTLVMALQDRDGHVRGLAARVLREIGNEKAIPLLYDALLKESYSDVKEVIGESLSSYEGGVVKERFIALSCEKDPSLRVIGVRGLGGIDTEDSRQALIKALNDSSPMVRKEAIRSLGRFKGLDITSLLAGSLEDDERDVRMAVLDVLESIDGGEGLLISAMKDRDMWVRFRVVNILGEKKGGIPEDAIIALLINDEIPVKIACANLLGDRGSKGAIPILEGLKGHSDPYLRDAVKAALEKIKV